MSHIETKASKAEINFLASSTGLITKTCTVSATGVKADEYGKKIVPAGTVFPANTASAKGILFHDVDVTNGDHEGSLIIAGRVLKDRLPAMPAEAAIPALNASGIVFEESSETTRG